MGGGGGGGPFVGRTPEQLRQQVRETEDQTAIKEFETELGGLLSELLASANSRDVDKVRDRLDEIKDALEGHLETAIDSLFGGSVAKHTYVDGLSDVDSLLILDDPDWQTAKPSKAIESVAAVLSEELGNDVKVTSGGLAVTVAYPDGQEIQLLPAFKTATGHKVSSFMAKNFRLL
jgi:tRNA nucleotidyltransferase (CCA-adding enzyme)